MVLTLGRNSAILVTQRVLVWVRVKETLRILVPDLDGVVEMHADAVLGHDIVCERLLERGRHEIVAGAASVQDAEVNLEPEKVEEQWDDDQANSAGNEMFSEFLNRQPLPVIEEIPKVDGNSCADCQEGEYTDVLCGNNARQRNTGEEKPFPPFSGEGRVPELRKSDIAEDGQCHGQN